MSGVMNGDLNGVISNKFIPIVLKSFLDCTTLRYFFTISMSVNQLKKKFAKNIIMNGKAVNRPF